MKCDFSSDTSDDIMSILFVSFLFSSFFPIEFDIHVITWLDSTITVSPVHISTHIFPP